MAPHAALGPAQRPLHGLLCVIAIAGIGCAFVEGHDDIGTESMLDIEYINAMGAGMEAAQAWAGQPLNAILLILTAGAAIFHMRLGMQVVIEDYIEKTGTRSTLLILNSFACIALFVTVALSVLKLWIGAGA